VNTGTSAALSARSASDELAGERAHDRRVRRELRPRERAPRLPADVRDLHAPRIVHQHADEVLLRHRRPHDQHRPEQADEHQPQRRHPDRHERDPVLPHPATRTRRPVGQQRGDDGGEDDEAGNVGTGWRREPELSLLKDHGPVVEQQLEDRVEHVVPP
jgi:hypothetical protein